MNISTIQDYERQMWEAVKNRDAEAFRQLVSTNAKLYLGGQCYSGEEYAEIFKEFGLVSYEVTDFEIFAQTETACQVRYTITTKASDKTKFPLEGKFLIFSAWKNYADGWHMVRMNERCLSVSDMGRDELKQYLMRLIPETNLRRYVQEHNFRFSGKDLVVMAYEFSRNCEERTELLTRCASVLSKDACKLAKCFLKDLDKAKANFLEKNDCVYELRISTNGDSKEKILCNSYQGALDIVNQIIKERDVIPAECSYINVFKRPKLSYDEYSTYSMKVSLDYALNEIEYEYYNIIYDRYFDFCFNNNNCSSCNAHFKCHSAKFPCLLREGDIVKNHDNSYGIVLSHCSRQLKTTTCYTITLLNEKLRNPNSDTASYVIHAEPYKISKISMEDLPAKLKRICEKYIAYLKKTGEL